MKQRLLQIGLASCMGVSLAVMLIGLLAWPTPTRAALLCVHPTGGEGCAYTTIQAAVNAAGPGDVISITPGTYTQNIVIDKPLTFIGAGAASTIVDGGGAGRVFSSTSDLTVAELTVQNGNSSGSGGGLVTNGALMLTNVNVMSNTATLGGGAWGGGLITLSGGLFQNNQADTGGGLYSAQHLVLTDTHFISNTATGSGAGGAYANSATLRGGLFDNNLAPYGYGGGLAVWSILTVADTQFINNTAGGDGGGAFANSATTLTGSLFQNNESTSTDGGGLIVGGPLAILNTRFISNTAAGSGGGAYAYGGATLSDGFFQGNQAGTFGGGLYASNVATVSDTQFISNIVDGDGGGAWIAGSAYLSGGLFQANQCFHGDGGGVRVLNTLMLTDTEFIGNVAQSVGGGAVANNAVLSGGLFQNNRTVSAGGFGGGLSVGHLTLTGTQFLSNTTPETGSGGGLGAETVNITNGYFYDNHSGSGGGLVGRAVTMTNTQFISNTAASWGGGGAYFLGQASVQGGRFEDNQATAQYGSGGGLYSDWGLTLTATQFINNTAPWGGGAHIYNGPNRLVNALFARNSADHGSAALLFNNTTLLHATIVSPTVGAGSALYVEHGLTSITDTIISSYTIGIETGQGAAYQDYSVILATLPTSGAVSGGSHSLTGLDPAFVDPAADDYHLQRGSAAIDAGVDAGVTTDLDGNPRPQGRAPDIGAYEFHATWYVDSLGNDANLCAFPGPANACQTIMGAVGKAYGGDTIQMAAGTYPENVDIDKPLTFIGAGAASTIVDGGGAGRVFSSTSDLTVAELTVQNGNSSGSGGGLLTDGMLILTNVNVLSNTAGLDGGGAATNHALLNGGLFQNNLSMATTDAYDRGGGGLYVAGVLVFTDTQFISNTAYALGGGALAHIGPLLSGGLFLNNQGRYAGGLYVNSTLTLTGTQFISNTALEFGGGAHVAGAATVTNARFQNNRAKLAGGLSSVSGLMMTDTQFIHNYASEDGGGVVAAFDATIVGGLFQSNQTTDPIDDPYGRGGGLLVGTLVLTGTEFISNSAARHGGGAYIGTSAMLSSALFLNNKSDIDGGGLYAANALELVGTQFVSNTAAFVGGGAYIIGAATLSGGLFQDNTCTHFQVCAGGGLYADNDLALTGTQFINNAALSPGGACGGLYHGLGAGRVVNALFSRNRAGSGYAAALCEVVGQLAIVHTTIANPTVNRAAAVSVETGTVSITNSIIASHTIGIQQLGGAMTSDYNLFYNAPTSIPIGPHSLTGTNPLFVNPLAGDYHLAFGSPAAGAGIDMGVATDLDGNLRPTPPSIGAYNAYSGPVYQIRLPMVRR